LRRISIDQPFNDVIFSERTPRRERDIADHPSLKPQSFLRQIVRASLPLGQGVVLDPFMGSGSTVAAAQAQNIACIGVERFADYFELAKNTIPRLAHLSVEDRRSQLSLLEDSEM
jgi:site-specific DNA-methyltransferase (adenine-specific)